MFGSKKTTDNNSNSYSSGSPNSINSLVSGTSVDGNITADNDIRIDGKLTGNLVCKGKVIIGSEGKVQGEIICHNALIEGAFDGLLKVKDTLIVKDSARITGDVDTDKLNVDGGAVFNVNCKMGSGGAVKSINTKQEPIKLAN